MGDKIGKLALNARLTSLVFILHIILRLYGILSGVETSSEPVLWGMFWLFVQDNLGKVRGDRRK